MKTLLLSLCLALSTFGAGSVSVSVPVQIGTSGVWTMAFSWIGDASGGSVPATAMNTTSILQGFSIIGAEFVPGTPSPTSQYDVTVTTAYGIDVMGGAGANLSSSAASSATASSSAMPLLGGLTLNVSGNSVNSAQGTVRLYFQAPLVTAGGGGSNKYVLKSSGAMAHLAVFDPSTNTTATFRAAPNQSGPLSQWLSYGQAPGTEVLIDGSMKVYNGKALYFGDGGNANGLIQTMSGNDFLVSNANIDATITLATNHDGAGNIVLDTDGYIRMTGLPITPTATPASAAASGVAGTIAWDSSYLYVAVGENTWKRAALSTW